MLIGIEGIDQFGIEWVWLAFAVISPFCLGFIASNFFNKFK